MAAYNLVNILKPNMWDVFLVVWESGNVRKADVDPCSTLVNNMAKTFLKKTCTGKMSATESFPRFNGWPR